MAKKQHSQATRAAISDRLKETHRTGKKADGTPAKYKKTAAAPDAAGKPKRERRRKADPGIMGDLERAANSTLGKHVTGAAATIGASAATGAMTGLGAVPGALIGAAYYGYRAMTDDDKPTEPEKKTKARTRTRKEPPAAVPEAKPSKTAATRAGAPSSLGASKRRNKG